MILKQFKIVLLLIVSINSYSQEFIKLNDAKKESPTVIYNNKIIDNLKLIDSTKKKH